MLAGLAAFASGGVAIAAPGPGRIDVHHHVAPPIWVASNGNDAEMRPFRGWSVAKTLEDLDRGGVATAMASITIPGRAFDDPAAARRLSRGCNEYMAQMRAAAPAFSRTSRSRRSSTAPTRAGRSRATSSAARPNGTPTFG
jgi:hypothetical protein